MPSINDVSSEGEGGDPPQSQFTIFSNLSRQGEGGGHEFGKMGRRRLWMALKEPSIYYVAFLTTLSPLIQVKKLEVQILGAQSQPLYSHYCELLKKTNLQIRTSGS